MCCRALTYRLKTKCAASIILALLGLVSASCPATTPSALDLDGRPLDPLKLSPGKVVVLIFVRTDCPLSNRYAPTIQRLSGEYEAKAAFWLVYPSKSESAEGIRQHEREYGYKIPALRDPQRVLVKASEAQVTPEAAVFDASRRLIYHGRIDDLYVDMTRLRSAPTTHELDDAIQAAIRGEILSVQARPGVGCYISDLE